MWHLEGSLEKDTETCCEAATWIVCEQWSGIKISSGSICKRLLEPLRNRRRRSAIGIHFPEDCLRTLITHHPAPYPLELLYDLTLSITVKEFLLLLKLETKKCAISAGRLKYPISGTISLACMGLTSLSQWIVIFKIIWQWKESVI